jgi:uridine kinase
MADAFFHLVDEVRASSPPAGVATRIVAVDGLGGAGKTTVAERLGQALDAPVVHTDDFASWDDPVDWWPQLLAQVLEPLAAGRAARFTPSAWGGPPREPVAIEPAAFVIVEGVTASRAAFRPYVAYAIWVEAPRDLRLARGLARGGDNVRERWEAWMTAEDRYVELERPAEHVNRVLPGDLW